MRLDKLLANTGHGSRKEVKKLLKQGIVQIDGAPVKDGSIHVNLDKETVTIKGEIVNYQEYIYMMLNKPMGYISATEDNKERCVVDLLTEEDRMFDPFPVGRLDKDTEGLLLLTNDGQLAHELLAPKKKVEKVYWAEIDGKVTEEDVEAFARGVTLEDGYVTKPGKLKILKSDSISEIELTITEGKFHQVKRMFLSVGKKVQKLKRLQMGTLSLDPSLKLGEYRYLTDEELNTLRP
ncbi:16S rRNA pseudouridine516 synthase [Salirhabdus euzebyi]|uniref:Pseudouridine synthase n=1 Tax=Salirhabdus euzebyi TaxID=394506 RepID=A0A841PXI4_9BACI|nr:pseudouridine synthase [Salirhabdus euzebyi]MBB6452166.1 16S rRNA pseudouridine516 synthase [Salirhabdus euzebyi]